MRKLDEQWIEEIDGKKHMLKAVNYPEGCNGCIFLRYDPDEFYTCNRSRLGCPVDDGMIIKDLGILNEDGCLPAPWDETKYPQMYRTTEAIRYAYAESYRIFIEVKGKTKQEVIDTWNRRA